MPKLTKRPTCLVWTDANNSFAFNKYTHPFILYKLKSIES